MFSLIGRAPAARLMCNQRKVLRKLIQHIISDGGEGVILRRPRSIYLHGRSDSLIKLKVCSNCACWCVGVCRRMGWFDVVRGVWSYLIQLFNILTVGFARGQRGFSGACVWGQQVL